MRREAKWSDGLRQARKSEKKQSVGSVDGSDKAGRIELNTRFKSFWPEEPDGPIPTSEGLRSQCIEDISGAPLIYPSLVFGISPWTRLSQFDPRLVRGMPPMSFLEWPPSSWVDRAEILCSLWSILLFVKKNDCVRSCHGGMTSHLVRYLQSPIDFSMKPYSQRPNLFPLTEMRICIIKVIR